MKVETLCWAISIVGLILTLIGRRLIISEAASISDGWCWAVRLLPLADIMFLARFWDSAKVGAFTSLAGLMCFLPLGGKTLWDKKHPKPNEVPALTRKLLGDDKNEIYMSMKAEHEAQIAAKQRKLEQLNSHMAAWYANMMERRAALSSATPEEISYFNTEAAAYQSLHQITKDEAAILQTLLDRRMNSWGDISDAEYAQYVIKTSEQSKRRKIGTPKLKPDSVEE